VKSGWGSGINSAGLAADASLGQGAVKEQKASYWDNKTTELVIPEMGDEF
jgi:hypothetical protein